MQLPVNEIVSIDKNKTNDLYDSDKFINQPYLIYVLNNHDIRFATFDNVSYIQAFNLLLSQININSVALYRLYSMTTQHAFVVNDRGIIWEIGCSNNEKSVIWFAYLLFLHKNDIPKNLWGSPACKDSFRQTMLILKENIDPYNRPVEYTTTLIRDMIKSRSYYANLSSLDINQVINSAPNLMILHYLNDFNADNLFANSTDTTYNKIQTISYMQNYDYIMSYPHLVTEYENDYIDHSLMQRKVARFKSISYGEVFNMLLDHMDIVHTILHIIKLKDNKYELTFNTGGDIILRWNLCPMSGDNDDDLESIIWFSYLFFLHKRNTCDTMENKLQFTLALLVIKDDNLPDDYVLFRENNDIDHTNDHIAEAISKLPLSTLLYGQNNEISKNVSLFLCKDDPVGFVMNSLNDFDSNKLFA